MANKNENSGDKRKKRAKPGTKGGGEYFRVVLRPKTQFTVFRYHDVGDPGKILRLAGKKADGSWDDQAWLIDKDMARIENGKLVSDEPDVVKLLETIGPAVHDKGDIFTGQPR